MFCRYCGKEILDEAVLCPHCGVMVKNVTLPTQQVQNVPKKVKEEKTDTCCELKQTRLTRIFGIVSAVLSGLVLMILFGGIVEQFGYFMGYSSSIYDMNALMDAASGAFLFSMIGLGFGIASFVLGLKQKNVGVRYLSTVIFVASIFATLISMVCM